MKIDKLIQNINNYFNVDVCSKSRKRNVVYARKVYCYLGYNLRRKNGARIYTYEQLAKPLHVKHDLVLYHAKSIDVVNDEFKEYINTFISKNNLRSELSFENIQETNTIPEKLKDINPIVYDMFKELNDLSDTELLEFKTTRFDIFMKLCKKRRYQKEIPFVKGATLKTAIINNVSI